VIGLNAGDGIGDSFSITSEYIDTWVLGAIESQNSLPPDPNGVVLLASKVDEAAASNEGQPQEVGTPPAIAQTISGRTFELDANSYGFSELRLSFPENDEATLKMGIPEVIGGPTLELQLGLDGVNRFSPGRHGVMTAAMGSWVSNNRFSAIIDEIALINLWRWDLEFDGDTVTLYLESLAGGELPATVTGMMVP
jgi:hypothetical protein